MVSRRRATIRRLARSRLLCLLVAGVVVLAGLPVAPSGPPAPSDNGRELARLIHALQAMTSPVAENATFTDDFRGALLALRHLAETTVVAGHDRTDHTPILVTIHYDQFTGPAGWVLPIPAPAALSIPSRTEAAPAVWPEVATPPPRVAA